MNNLLGTASELFVIVFNILAYMEVTDSRDGNIMIKLLMSAGSLVVLLIVFLQKRKLRALREQLSEEKKWHRIAYEDALTGLNNRMAYIERINGIERSKPNDAAVHAVMIDVDNFKHVNDTMGHQFGDLKLQEIAKYIQKAFHKENCSVFRIGGDEFAVIAIGMDDKDLEAKLKYISKYSVEDLGCSISVGSSKVDFEKNRAVELAFEAADRKMYEQKSLKREAALGYKVCERSNLSSIRV